MMITFHLLRVRSVIHASDRVNADVNPSSFIQGLTSHTDLKRMKQGRVGGQFWSIFIEVR
jgi:hypothetical protein